MGAVPGQAALQEFPCPVCGSSETPSLYPDTLGGQLPVFGYDFSHEHTRTYQIVWCRACAHAFSSPRPAELWRCYQDVEDAAYLARQPDRLASAGKALARLRRHVPDGRLLDVGCATGDFLSVAQAHYHVEGLELSRWASAIARRRGLTVHQCGLQDLVGRCTYDVLTLWGVIEHFEHPGQELVRMSQLLRPGGIVALWTGDVTSIPSRLLKRRWWYIQGQHLQLFSRRSLRALFFRHGFREVWMGRYPYVLTMGSVSRSLGRYPRVRAALRWFLEAPGVRDQALTFALPGELFAIFQRAN